MAKAKPSTKAAEDSTQAPSQSVYTKLAKANKVACPIVSLSTSDPANAVKQIALACPGKPIILWDIARGATVPAGLTEEPKQAAIAAIAACGLDGDAGLNPTEFLVKCESMPKDVIVVFSNAHRFLPDVAVMQAVWNLRDSFKTVRRLLVLMGNAIRLPAELMHDVIELDEPLPTASQLLEVAKTVAVSAGLDQSGLEPVADACQGLSAFAAEQLAALNATRADGISSVGVWADKCHKIDETPGLRVVSGGSFEDVAGVPQIKKFLMQILKGKEQPSAIVFVDEIEKSLAGAGGDTSGTSQDQLGVLLQWMQDKRAAGCILVGPPGAAKSAIAKTAGGSAGIPTIQLDLGGMKGSLVGESETRIRNALKVVDAVSGGNTLWIATCNSLTSLPPELRRRFKYGTWFFDLPTRDERAAIWELYTAKHQLELPSEDLLDQDWTGAEIESCCEIAWKCNISLEEASEYIVPVSKAAADVISSLRSQATGKFLSASAPGVYSAAQSAARTAPSYASATTDRDFE